MCPPRIEEESPRGALPGSQDLLRFIACGYLLGHYAEVDAADREKGSYRPMARLEGADLEDAILEDTLR